MEGLIMFLNITFQVTCVIDSDKFSKLFDRVYSALEYVDENKYADYMLASKGITVLYRDSQYKKKIKLIVNPCRLLDSDKPDPDKLVRKLEKQVGSYFRSKYLLDDFDLTGLALVTDINVHSQANVAAYMKVLKRIGKVKGFSPSRDDWPGDDAGLYLDGNSNGINFMLYDLGNFLREQAKETDCGGGEQKALTKKSEGLLRAEVRLVKQKAIHAYTDESLASAQIADLSSNIQKIFLDTFMRVVPFGNFYKKHKAEEIIRAKVEDLTIRRRMLWLVELLPDKKSLLLAQKALNYRRIDEVMAEFRSIEVSPVTISKRHDIKKLDNLYKYM
jgi:hypothetical protein